MRKFMRMMPIASCASESTISFTPTQPTMMKAATSSPALCEDADEPCCEETHDDDADETPDDHHRAALR